MHGGEREEGWNQRRGAVSARKCWPTRGEIPPMLHLLPEHPIASRGQGAKELGKCSFL